MYSTLSYPLGCRKFSQAEIIKTMFDAHYRATLKWQPQPISDQARKRRKKKAAKRVAGESVTSSSDEEQEEDDDDNDNDNVGQGGSQSTRSKTAAAAAGDKTSLPGAGIRKVRLGTFQDSGKCKGSVSFTLSFCKS